MVFILPLAALTTNCPPILRTFWMSSSRATSVCRMMSSSRATSVCRMVTLSMVRLLSPVSASIHSCQPSPVMPSTNLTDRSSSRMTAVSHSAFPSPSTAAPLSPALWLPKSAPFRKWIFSCAVSSRSLLRASFNVRRAENTLLSVG